MKQYKQKVEEMNGYLKDYMYQYVNFFVTNVTDVAVNMNIIIITLIKAL